MPESLNTSHQSFSTLDDFITRWRESAVAEILAALASIGQAREVDAGCFVR